MPTYRMIHAKTPSSDDINAMPNDTVRLLYVMFFIILDSAGRGYDDSSWIRSQAFPKRRDVTLEQIDEAMDWYEQRGMILRYESKGKKCFWDPAFEPHQRGLHKEAKSVIPAPSYDLVERFLAEYELTHDKVERRSVPTPELVQSKFVPDADADTKTDAEAKTDADADAVIKTDDSGSTWVSEDFLSSFLEYSKLQEPTDAKELGAWISSLSQLEQLGVTTEIMARACRELTEKKYKIVSPASIVKACQIILAGKARMRDPTPLSRESEFSQYIRH